MTVRWIGRWLIAVGVIHCLVGGTTLIEPLTGIVQDGLWHAVQGDIVRQLAFWFEFAGLLTILFGALMDWVEKEVGRFPRLLGYGLSALMLLVIIVLPTGGGWLLLPATIGLLIKKKTRTIERRKL